MIRRSSHGPDSWPLCHLNAEHVHSQSASPLKLVLSRLALKNLKPGERKLVACGGNVLPEPIGCATWSGNLRDAQQAHAREPICVRAYGFTLPGVGATDPQPSRHTRSATTTMQSSNAALCLSKIPGSGRCGSLGVWWTPGTPAALSWCSEAVGVHGRGTSYATGTQHMRSTSLSSCVTQVIRLPVRKWHP